MKIAIVTNLNGLGLQTEAELLAEFLGSLEHKTDLIQYDGPISATDELYDLAIYLEVVPQDKLFLAPVRYAFLNPEWLKPDVVKLIARTVRKVFAKTHEAERIFKELFPGLEVAFTGFLARDRYRPEIARLPRFLHVGGNSSLRGTQALVDALKWTHEEEKPFAGEIIIVTTALEERPEIPGVSFLGRIEDELLIELQNSCKFHLYPSGTEGFGHAIHEAMSCNAVILTTDAPPMDEIENVYPMGTCGVSSYNYATVYQVSAIDLQKHMRHLLYLEEREYDFLKPRGEFLRDNEQFKTIFSRHLKEAISLKTETPGPAVKTDRSGNLKIAFLGNFQAAESTENMIKWAIEADLNHEVLTFQENQVLDVRDLKSLCEGMDAFLWVRTPGWLRVSDREMFDFLEWIQAKGTTTISLHLDKFWGISERERLIGQIPFWKTQHVWTADGGFQEKFKSRGVNHHWLVPAVSKVYCHPGWPCVGYACDIGFVGARSYHNEYPFRERLVQFLETEYRGHFRHIEGLRGHGLNDFYASCKIAVGDCIFAGTPFYWSDRLPETCGRHGFLLHPRVEGLNVGTACYTPQDLNDLAFQIDYYLTRPRQLREIRENCAHAVANHHTWTERMRQVLKESLDATQL